MPTWRPIHLPQLDGLRAAAVALVVVYHVVQTGHGPWVHGAFLGVDVFFVLSGFLITSLLIDEQRTRGRLSLSSFYRRRFWRLYPGLVLASVTLAAWFALVPNNAVPSPDTAHETLTGALFALGYVASWAVAFHHSIGYLGHTWSLSVEEHFYLLWPLIFLLLVRRERDTLVRSTAFLTAGAATWPVVLMLLHAPTERVYAAPDGRAVQLLVGCLLATLLAQPEGSGRLRRLSGAGMAWLAVLVLALGVVGLRRQYVVYVTLGQVVIALAAATLIAHLVLHDGRLSRLLSWRPAVVVGTWSYGIYLWHAGMMLVPYAFLGAGLLPRVLGAALAVVAAALSFRYLERPLLLRYGGGRSRPDGPDAGERMEIARQRTPEDSPITLPAGS